ncbi:MAG: class III extradiol ring-cleavage dioxygenase [Actinomycetota bacterium]|nr:class III extradiol ring-cleavage dioxygenase [Actinomycetota bacterium]MDP2288239.1 class III extradiol ring-cleavage dioxygenase [Actinomycetota bacterium]
MASEGGEAFDLFEADALLASSEQSAWVDGALPSVFLSHGAPPLFDDPLWMSQLHAWALRMPKPTGIVSVSAHWEARPIAVTAAGPSTPLVYDFGGFHPRFYKMKYATPDAARLTKRVVDELSGLGAVRQSSRGIDHGTWVPLKVMYPLADVPVVQVSLPTHDPSLLLNVGERLKALRSEGVLIIGSGFMTHGLPYIDASMISGAVPSWSSDFDSWVQTALQAGDLDTLAGYLQQAPGLPYAHPTVEHFVPLFVSLGAADDPTSGTTQIDGFFWGLSKRSLSFA